MKFDIVEAFNDTLIGHFVDAKESGRTPHNNLSQMMPLLGDDESDKLA